MPLNWLSKQYGTMIVRENARADVAHPSSRPTFLSSNSNCQSPFSVSHRSRWNWGCGYRGAARGTAPRGNP